MSDFEALRNLYYAQKRANYKLLDFVRDFVMIPGMCSNKVEQILNHPIDNDEINFCFSFLELSKRLYKVFSELDDPSKFNPYESEGYEFILRNSISFLNDLGVNSLDNCKNDSKSSICQASLNQALQTRFDMINTCGEDRNKYYKLCVEINILYRVYFNEIISNIISKNFNVNYSEIYKTKSGENKLKYYETVTKYSAVGVCCVPFESEKIIGNQDAFCDNDVKRANDYLSYYKRYVSHLNLGRK